MDREPVPILRNSLEPIQMVVLQGTTGCNLNCDYCYLSESSRRSNRVFPLTSVRDLFTNIFTSRYVGSHMVVCWHSGEPLLLKPSYYDRSIEIIDDLANRHCASNFSIRFDVQTNGTLINDSWCEFFRRHHDRFKVGVSCDGPAFLHDAHRQTWSGRPTHEQVVRGLDQLCRAEFPFSLIAVVPPSALDYPDELFDFVDRYRDHLADFHFNFMDVPLGSIRKFSVDEKERARYYRFLRRLLQRIAECDQTPLPFSIRNFAHMYKKMFGSPEIQQQLSARAMSRPFKTLNVEVNGDVTTFYAGITSREHKDLYGDGRGLVIGNLMQQPLDEIAEIPKLQRIAQDFEVSHRACELACDYFDLCSGGFNLIKQARFGAFEATETPECTIHTKMMVDAMVDDLQAHANRQALA